jgi:hypothetical protein
MQLIASDFWLGVFVNFHEMQTLFIVKVSQKNNKYYILSFEWRDKYAATKTK